MKYAIAFLLLCNTLTAETQNPSVTFGIGMTDISKVTWVQLSTTGGTLDHGDSSSLTTLSSTAGMFSTAVTVTGNCSMLWRYGVVAVASEDLRLTLTSEQATQLASAANNTASLNPIALYVSTASVGAAPAVNITAYQYATLGPLTITASTSQTGKQLKMQVYKSGPPQTQVFALTSSGGQISVGGAGGNSLTLSGGIAYTSTAGVYSYLLKNATDNAVISNGTLTIVPAPSN